MTVTLTLSPDEERRLTERAALVGQDLPGYLRRLIREDLEAERPAKSQAFAEALAPVHEDFRRSGMTEDELDELVEEVREEVWQEQHGRPSKAS